MPVISYSNTGTVLARVIDIYKLPDREYQGEIQKSKQITVQIDNDDPVKIQRLTLSLSGRVAEYSIKIDDVKIFHFNYKAKKHNGKYYNNLYVWRISNTDGSTAYQPTKDDYVAKPTSTQENKDSYDEYKF